ncbi:MAG: extracellular catalytic domain type 1 short-chain-length polyhydroxyalkanoate depolymerase [Candidatus Binataceae bacterium]
MTRRLLLVLLVFVVALLSNAAASATETAATGTSGCRASGLAPGTYERTLAHGGWTRSYRLHVPPGYHAGEPMALVLSFHGGGGNAEVHERMTGLVEKADSAGFILAGPDGIPSLIIRSIKTWNAGNCCGRAKSVAADDVGFVRSLIDAISAEVCIDPRRVYATGLSNGAMISYRLACELSDRIAAIAPVGGAMGDRDLSTNPPTIAYRCTPSRPVAILHIHGLDDHCYNYDGGNRSDFGGVTFRPVSEAISSWVQLNHCRNETAGSYEHGAARCRTYQGCEGGGDVTLCTIDGGGHMWPGREYAAWLRLICGGNATQDLIANDLIWDFFVAHPTR